MNLDEINKKLEELSLSLNAIDYNKELKKDEAKKVTDKVEGIDNLIEQESFGKDELDKAVEVLKELKTKAEDGYNTAKSGAKDSFESLKAKKSITVAISKYEYLFKQKEVIDQYLERMDKNDENRVFNKLVSMKEDKIKSNEKEIKEKKKLKIKIEKFLRKESVKNNIDEIQKLDKENKEIEKILEKVEKLIELEDDVKKETDPSLKKVGENEVKAKKKDLKDGLDKLDKGLYSDDLNKVKTDISDRKTKNVTNIEKAANEIKTEIGKEDEKVKKALEKVATSTSEPEKIAEKIKDVVYEIDGEIDIIDMNSDELKYDISLIKDDLTREKVDYINSPHNAVKTKYVPTDAEIENDPDYKAAMVPMDREDLIEARTKFLKEQAGIDDDGLHPLIWLKSRLVGKSVDKQMLAKTKEAVRTKLIQARQLQENEEYDKKADASERKDTARTKFVDELTRNVLTNKVSDIKDMGKQASKAYETTEAQKYDER